MGAAPLRIVLDARRISDFGIGTYIRNLISALAGLDAENHYTIITGPEEAKLIPAAPPNFEQVQYSGSGRRWIDTMSFAHFLRRFNAGLFHIPLNDVPLFMPKPYVVTIHDMSTILFGPHRSGWRDEVNVHRFRRGLLRANQVISVSDATRRDVRNLIGIPEKRIRVIYNAPDPIFTNPPLALELEETHRVMERYQINYPFLLYAGNIRPQKNIPRLIEAFAVARGELASHPVYSDLRLIIIGDEISKYPSVRHAVIKSRVEQAVRFLGFVPITTLRIFYKQAAAFVFPSLYEGFGLPPMEAMACGTPVITSNVSSLPEVVGDAAIIVNPENLFDIERGIKESLLDQDLRRSCIEKGYRQVGRFSWRRTAEQVLEVYREVGAGDRVTARARTSSAAE